MSLWTRERREQQVPDFTNVSNSMTNSIFGSISGNQIQCESLVAPTLVWPSPTPRAPCAPAGGSSLPRTARPVQVDIYVRVCVIGFGVWTVSDSVRFACYGPARRRCRVWASSRVPGGCAGASVSVVCALRGSLSRQRWVPCPFLCAGASVAQGAV